MRIKTLDIYGYGKWVDQRFELDEAMQLFYGQNEAGKSTLQSFIRSILFGFPSKRRRVNQLNRFEPKEGERYGGRLLMVDTSYGDIWIERTMKGLKVTTIDGESLPSHTLENVLGGLDETLFDHFYAFTLQNLQELSNIDATQLNDYFLSIGTVGSDQFLKIAKQYQKETDDFYRPQAQSRPLNQLLAEYDALAQAFQQTNQKMAQYDQLLEQKKEQDLLIETLSTEIQQLESELRDLDKLVGRYDIYLKARATKRELEGLVYTPIESEMVDTLTNAIKQNQLSKERLIQLEERVRNITGEMGTLTKLTWANNHEEERRQWLIATQQAKEHQANIESLIDRIREQNEIMMQLAHRGQFFPEKVSQDAAYVAKMDEGLEIQGRKLSIMKAQDNLRAERKVYLEQRKEQQNYSVLARQQVVKLETQRMNEETQLMSLTSWNHYFFGALFILIGLGIVAVNYWQTGMSANVYLWVGMILMLIGASSTVYIYVEHRKHYIAFNQSPIVDKIKELKEKERLYQEQSQAIGLQINQREAQLEELSQEMLDVNALQSRWLYAIGFYPTADAEIILKTNPVKQYFEAKELLTQYEHQKDELSMKVREWRALVQPIFERFPIGDSDTRQSIRHVEEVEVALTKTQERGAILETKIAQAKEEIEQHRQAIEERDAIIETIFEQTKSSSETEFYQKIEINRRIEELQTMSVVYEEQMVGYESQLEKVENKQTLLEAYHKLEHQVETLKMQLNPHHHQRANLVVSINHLEHDGTYQEQQQQLENKQSAIKSAIIEWGRKRVAMELLYRTLRQGLDNPLPEMNQLANELFETLSYGRYNHIQLSNQGIKVKQFSDIYFEPHELSQGTLEQLYVALRLAFIEKVRTMVKMPIIIDDAFVNFDEHRKASMYQVLKKISEHTQVLFFTFDQQARDTFDTDAVIDLDSRTRKEIGV